MLHTCRAVVLAQTAEAAPGLQTRSVQVPAPVHEYPYVAAPAQAALVYPSPSALHTRRVLTSAHEKAPGVQVHAAQTPALQLVLAPQAVSV